MGWGGGGVFSWPSYQFILLLDLLVLIPLLMNSVKTVHHHHHHSSLQDHIKPGNVIMLTSRACNKSLMVDRNGMPQCNVNPQLRPAGAQFEVMASPYSNRAYKLRNMENPQYFLAIFNGYFIGNVS